MSARSRCRIRGSSAGDIAGSAQIIPTRLTFVDIAGLVRGASKGEGLGNQFLANIREVDAIAHVVRCFEDGDITHVEGKIAPLADIETIETELMLADLDSLEKRVATSTKKAKGGDKEAKEQLDLVDALRSCCCAKASRRALVERKPEEERSFRHAGPADVQAGLYVCNVEEGAAARGQRLSAEVSSAPRRRVPGGRCLRQDRSEIAMLPLEEQAEFLEALGLEEAGLEPGDPRRLLTSSTSSPISPSGPKEARAWTITRVRGRRRRPA